VKTARGIIVNGIREVSVRKYGICYYRPTRWDVPRSVASTSHRMNAGLGHPKVDGRSNRQKQLTLRMMLSETRSLSVASTRQRRVRTWNKTSIDQSIDRSLTAMAGWL
jgi:hypothetical protein